MEEQKNQKPSPIERIIVVAADAVSIALGQYAEG